MTNPILSMHETDCPRQIFCLIMDRDRTVLYCPACGKNFLGSDFQSAEQIPPFVEFEDYYSEGGKPDIDKI